MSEVQLSDEFDARVWASEFNKTLVKLGNPKHDEAWLVSWFANAIMAGYDNSRWMFEKDKLSDENILGAVARGWCTERNKNKVMDVDLAQDIGEEVKMHLKSIVTIDNTKELPRLTRKLDETTSENERLIRINAELVKSLNLFMKAIGSTKTPISDYEYSLWTVAVFNGKQALANATSKEK